MLDHATYADVLSGEQITPSHLESFSQADYFSVHGTK